MCGHMPYKSTSLVTECLIALLGLIVNLTHEDQLVAQRFTEPDVLSCIIRCMLLPHSNDDTDAQKTTTSIQGGTVDVIVTSVGVLVNLIDKTSVDVGHVEINLECKGDGMCLDGCTCRNKQYLIDALCDLYKKHEFSVSNLSVAPIFRYTSMTPSDPHVPPLEVASGICLDYSILCFTTRNASPAAAIATCL